MKTIIYDVLHNITFLMSGFYLLGKLSSQPITQDSKQSLRILYGLCLSVLAIVLMQMTIEPAPGILVDLRHIPVIVAAYFAGPLPTFIVTVAIIVYRFTISTNFAAYAACFFIISLAVGISLIVKLMPLYSKKTFMTVTLYATLLHAVILGIVLRDTGQIVEILSVITPASFVSSWLTLLIIQDIRMTKLALRTFQHKAQIDFLTGLHNSRAFSDYLTDIKRQSIFNEQQVALVMIDIDHFKSVNDTYGHEAGDDVLRQFSKRLRDGVGDTGYLSRNGGEEFSLIITNLALTRVLTLAEELRERIETAPFTTQTGQTLHVTASFGVASFEETTANIDHLVRHADQALYASKQSGRNQVTLHSVKEEIAKTT